MLTVPQLLHYTIRDLHLIQGTTDENALRKLLHKTISDIFVLLNINTVRKREVLITTNAFSPLDVVFHLPPHDLPQESDASYASIIEYLGEKDKDVDPLSVHNKLLSALADSANGDRRPIRIKESYLAIVSRFSKLVSYVTELNNSAEIALLEFFSNCFAVEQRYYASIGSHMDVLHDADTDKIIDAIDSFVDRPELETTAALLDSIFSYDDISQNKESSEALNFHSTDADLNNLYEKFLHLSLYKTQDPFRGHSNAKVMLSFYKRSIHAKFLEIKEINPLRKKLDVVKEFFLAMEGGEYEILPQKYSSLYSEIIEEITNQNRTRKSAMNSILLETTLTAEQVDMSGSHIDLLTDEAADLISQVSAVFKSIGESGMEIDQIYPQLFRQYLIDVFEKMPELVIPKDSEYIRSVAATIQAIIDYKEEDDLKTEQSSLIFLIRKLLDVQNTLIEAHPQQTILMRLAVGEHLRMRSTLIRSFRHWNLRLLKVRQMDVVCEEKYPKSNHQKLLKSCFSRWYRYASQNKDLYKHAAIYSDRQTLTRYFDRCLIQPLILISKKEAEANAYFCRAYLQKWANRYRMLKTNETELLRYISDNLLGKSLASLCDLYNKRVEYMSIACQHREQAIARQDKLIISNAFRFWTNRLLAKCIGESNPGELSDMFKQLDLSARVVILRKPFNKWVKKMELQQSVRALDRTRKHIVLKASFFKWHLAHYLTELEKQCIAEQDILFKRRVFGHWLTIKNRHKTANEKYRAGLLNSYFKTYRISLAEKRLLHSKDNMTLRVCFSKWTLSQAFTETRDSSVGELFKLWHLRSEKVNSDHLQAVAFYNQKIKLRALSTWYDVLLLVENQNDVADLNFQRNMFNRISRRMYQRQLHEEQAIGYFSASQESQELALVKSCFGMWQSKYYAQFEAKSEILIHKFKREVSEKRILRLNLRRWFTRHEQIVEKERALVRQLESFRKNSFDVRSKFDQWIDATNAKFDLVENADEFYIGSLYVKHWRVWFQKYARIANLMNNQADDLADRKDYESAVAILRKWYYKYATITSATENICKTFLEKKRRVNLRIMFEFWVHKVQSKRPEYMLDAYGEANTSFGSNTSPLAGKSGDFKVTGSILGNDTYFYSPIGASSPYTPVKHKTSPTRLQETNQRLKLHRMDALTRHFRNANINDESRRSLYSGPFPKLSPPKQHMRSKLKQPPPAPNFGELQHEIETAPAFEVRSSSPSEVGSDEASLIETAKNQQRIRPIIIPFEESPSGLRYSTLHALRDRLQSAQSSPKRIQ